MLIVFQVPFADLRQLFLSGPDATRKPHWPHPSEDQFIRRLGYVRSRNINERPRIDDEREMFVTERKFVRADRLITRLNGTIKLDENSLKYRIAFSRIIGNGPIVSRLEIGISITSDKKFWHSQGNASAIVSKIMSLKIFSFSTEIDKKYDFYEFCYKFKIMYCMSTQIHNGKFLFDKEKFLDLEKSIVVVLPNNHNYKWLSSRSVLNKDASGYDVCQMYDSRRGSVQRRKGYIRIIAIGNHSKDDLSVRQFRISYLRVRSELLGLFYVINKVNSINNFTDINLPVLESFLSRSIDRIKDTLDYIRMGGLSNQHFEIFQVEKSLSPSFISHLNEIGSRLICEAKIMESLSMLKNLGDSSNVQIENLILDMKETKMSKYNFHGPVSAAIIGDDGRANDFIIQLDLSDSTTTTNKDLISDLRKLGAYIEDKESSSHEKDISLSALNEAEIAMKDKDDRKFLNSLKSAGNWTLGVATKIGVPVAIDALKKALSS